MIHVMVVDDHALVREGIKRILDDARGIRMVAEAASGEEALEQMKEVKPDVVLMDVSMPGMGGIEATRKIMKLYPRTRVIILSVHDEEPYPTRLLAAGAAGYLTKGGEAGEMVAALRAVTKGERYIGNDIAQRLALATVSPKGSSPFDKLSQREMQVLLMVTQGQNTQDISDKLCLSPKTVSTYRYRLYDKLKVDNDVELTHLAIRHGLIEPPEVIR